VRTTNTNASFVLGMLLILGMLTFSAYAQDCTKKLTSSKDSSHFDINQDGTITDIDTGLTWQRCVVGQTWNGLTCEGQAKQVVWQDAMKQSVPTGQSNADKHWRLPKLNELAGIVDIHCQSPRINLDLFPATEAKPFWTTNNTPTGADEAYTLSFGREGVQRTSKAEKHYVRLVSGRE